MLKKIVSVMVLLTLTFAQVTFSESLSKVDYSKSLVKGLGFEVKSAQSAYKRDTTESEDVIYTAFQLGLLNGVSWDFENPMTDEEREIILANAMVIYNQKKNENAEIDDSEVTLEEVSTVSPQVDVNFETPYGEIKKPSDMSPNDEMWTDDEFHDLMVEYVNGGSMFNESFNKHPHWKYDEDTRQFIIHKSYFSDEYIGSKYIEIDKQTNGEYFHMLKGLIYHAYRTGLDVNLRDFLGDRVGFSISHSERGFKNMYITLIPSPRERDYIYKSVPNYEVGKTVIVNEWCINNLFDVSAFEDEGYDYVNMDVETGTKILEKYRYAEQSYADFLYGMCDYLYGDSGFEMYKFLMTEYMKDEVDAINGIEYKLNSDFFEITGYNIFKLVLPHTDKMYGISVKK